jgi:hypothetical protein
MSDFCTGCQEFILRKEDVEKDGIIEEVEYHKCLVDHIGCENVKECNYKVVKSNYRFETKDG